MIDQIKQYLSEFGVDCHLFNRVRSEVSECDKFRLKFDGGILSLGYDPAISCLDGEIKNHIFSKFRRELTSKPVDRYFDCTKNSGDIESLIVKSFDVIQSDDGALKYSNIVGSSLVESSLYESSMFSIDMARLQSNIYLTSVGRVLGRSLLVDRIMEWNYPSLFFLNEVGYSIVISDVFEESLYDPVSFNRSIVLEGYSQIQSFESYHVRIILNDKDEYYQEFLRDMRGDRIDTVLN